MAILNEPRQYGDICRIWVVHRAFVQITSPELMKPILSSRSLITKSMEYRFFKPLTSEGLIDSTGKENKMSYLKFEALSIDCYSLVIHRYLQILL